jgi:hypothetical protein
MGMETQIYWEQVWRKGISFLAGQLEIQFSMGCCDNSLKTPIWRSEKVWRICAWISKVRGNFGTRRFHFVSFHFVSFFCFIMSFYWKRMGKKTPLFPAQSFVEALDAAI